MKHRSECPKRNWRIAERVRSYRPRALFPSLVRATGVSTWTREAESLKCTDYVNFELSELPFVQRWADSRLPNPHRDEPDPRHNLPTLPYHHTVGRLGTTSASPLGTVSKPWMFSRSVATVSSSATSYCGPRVVSCATSATSESMLLPTL